MPTNWLTTFARPEDVSKNDRIRQKTQSRSNNFPYDRQTSYGKPLGTSNDGSSYERQQTTTPPKPKNKKAKDVIPYGQYGRAFENLKLKNFFIFADDDFVDSNDCSDHVYAPDAEFDL